jgi:PIN domain nuclease of toxin-antitoxin system
MRLLLDTHALIWWLAGDQLLSRVARAAIRDEDNEIFVSAASAWEITTKHRLGKLDKAEILAADVAGIVAGQGFLELPMTLRHAQSAGSLGGGHKDPFDRMLIAQATLEGMSLVSRERLFDAYGVHRLW